MSEWFNEAGLRAMEHDLREETTFVAVDGKVLGFITTKPFNGKALEILWMAVIRELRGKGIKTSSDPLYRPYDETRRFYNELSGRTSAFLKIP